LGRAVLYERCTTPWPDSSTMERMRARVRYWLAPEMRSIELIAADYVAQRFAPHWHTGFAVGTVTRNMQRFAANGRDWVVQRGDLILLNPGQVHDGSSMHPEGWSSRMAYVPEAALIKLMGGCAHSESPSLRFVTPVVRDPALADLFTRWHEETELQHARGDASLLRALVGVVAARWMRPAARSPRSHPDPFEQAVDLSECVRRLSEAQGGTAWDQEPRGAFSRSTQWRRSRSKWGMSLQALRSHLRVVHAKQALVSGCSVIDAALDAGYYDQSHFTRRFCAAYGMTPGQFRSGQVSVRQAVAR
jgi:hypothetical protein